LRSDAMNDVLGPPRVFLAGHWRLVFPALASMLWILLLWAVGGELLRWRVERPTTTEMFEASLVDLARPRGAPQPVVSHEPRGPSRPVQREEPTPRTAPPPMKEALHAATVVSVPKYSATTAAVESAHDLSRSRSDSMPSQANLNLAAGPMGPRAVFSPLPKIPDELREDATDVVALVRFHVAADGSATVELIRPTSNPLVNRIVLQTLATWRFSPAIADGKPVAAVQDVRVRVEVM
jgi:periplasmic protein TonB